MTRHVRATQAEETLALLRSGQYDLEPMLSGTQLFTPADQAALLAALHARRGQFETRFEVTAEDTISAICRLTAEAKGPVATLNFASAKNAGGGFLGGAKAQEEDLCRSSGLYLSLTTPQAAPYYAENRACASALYTDHLIYSPHVPIFRGGGGEWLEVPVHANFITAPAPNAGAVAQNTPARLAQVRPTLRQRAALVLGAAAQMGQTRLVLGAWGCGVFRNDPAQVAQVFDDLLTDEAAGAFEQVVFAIYDKSKAQETLRAFEEKLCPPLSNS